VIFTDENVSGSKAVARPARDDLERRVAAGEFDAVLVKSVDRLARSVLDFHRIAATAEKRGAALVIIEAGLDTSMPAGRMMLGILAQFAEFEAATIGQRVTTSNAGLRREGRTRGGPGPLRAPQRPPPRPARHVP
jgi:site-specific DNA recombinase